MPRHLISDAHEWMLDSSLTLRIDSIGVEYVGVHVSVRM